MPRVRLKLAISACLVFANGVASADDNPHTRHGAGQGPAGEVHAEGGAAEAAGAGSTVVTAKSEVSAYADTDAVSVFTPALEGSIKDPLSGWSANGSYLVDIVSAASVDIVSTAAAGRAATPAPSVHRRGARVSRRPAPCREPDHRRFPEAALRWSRPR